MAKKLNKKVERSTVNFNAPYRVLEDGNVENVMQDNFLRYSMSVIVSRALPDIRDGLKPVHRRILHSMNENNVRSNGKTIKSARITGDVMGKYHPHGNVAIYDAMVRMAQDWNMRYPLIIGQGNFGSMDGHGAAAERYTEAKMHQHAEAMLEDIDKETVDFRENYDGSQMEPSVLPAKLPNLLLNGQLGIAVGMATSIPPHNLTEVVDATKHLMENPDAETADLLKFVKGPDFPTGGIVYGGSTLSQAYETGRGSVVVRGVAEIVDQGRGAQIVITEVPYGMNKAAYLEKVAELVTTKRITSISDIRDQSARGEIKIVIYLKKDAYPNKVLNQLYKLTPLQTSFSYNVVALIDGVQPKLLGLKEILVEFIKHRRVVVRRRTEFELKAAKARAHILEGLKIAIDNIDEVIKIIRGSQSSEDAQSNLIKRFKLSEIQAKAILDMPLRRLAALERAKIEEELAELLKLIDKLEGILADPKKIDAIIVDELDESVKKFGDERRTRVINAEVGKLGDEELIPDEQVVITMTKANYVKRNLASDYRKQNRGGKGKRGVTTREEDIVEHVASLSTHDYVLFFTNRGRVFRLRGYEIPSAGLSAKGTAIVNLLQLSPEENVTTMIGISKQEENGYLFMCTARGTVKKTPYTAYQNVRSTGLITIKLDDGDELKWVRLSSGEDEILISTAMGQAMRFDEKNVRSMGRNSRGVRGIRLRKDDNVISMDLVKPKSEIVVISEHGYGKRTSIEQFTPHARGGVGIRAAAVTAKTGKLVSVQTLTDGNEELLLITAGGQTIRVAANEISKLGRATQGVRVMRMNEEDTVVSLAVVHIDEEDGEVDSE
ncbi:DNA gyrase subunit A [Candidatus Saccharibacteria bacterium]|nr:DNA gyrase subunit A [Candidatus Saccharibacteria bacterium]